jgi:hypothetical protein
MWSNEGTLCSYLGAEPAIDVCFAGSSLYSSYWQGSFGQSSIVGPNGTVTADAYESHLQACAAAYTNLSPTAACTLFDNSNSYKTQWQNRVATNYWSGPVGQ